MIESTDGPPAAPAEPLDVLVTVQPVSADEGLRVLVASPLRECFLDGGAARSLARELLAAADVISPAG